MTSVKETHELEYYGDVNRLDAVHRKYNHIDVITPI